MDDTLLSSPREMRERKRERERERVGQRMMKEKLT
jgi:hypothetical protein